ncbi:putative Acyl-CoA N-acyltransferase [Vibrio nigripulchritudo SFn27]|uniref:Putative Acyl-CoA N-acyltransferase n=1 Tax=Vibrio nigripulchritudo TaxID=28173 RepID=U4K246_9VIBR|nr:N-acetyltransferase [Vibrio nigripulchritudo]CCN83221.1 putative Acyl-CoA N-acyltransferase [Vibrio nigripulchritudo BLFn1]CCN88596.1 putative Acyl-CoA N-acyltransferase [Vibrio nigripulchritudo SFn27]CCN92734.1 putative Acyl-CoA N-acyltransferase [Vibrio nigripulchritudo ENn2]CCO40320.1 putative Acyl-CoA N-acyltransferase [Vibrio nigripulchritudo SFn135]CCO52696.1 putative Acyl-CoA N-acyltransferase [Vibrio nigripulchritudo Wn13]
MLIRTEAPADILPIQQLIRQAFPTHAEAELVSRLMENGQRTLSLVACSDEGEVVGYILFSPVTLDQQDYNWQGLAPLAVKEEYRGQGIASELIKEGLSSLAELGYPACVVLGEPEFYGRFGFESAAKYGMDTQWELPEGAFQIQELMEGELDGKSGKIFYSQEFSEL